MELTEARQKVLEQVASLDAQASLPHDGGTIAGYVALFHGVEPELAAQATWSLIEDGTLTFDKHTNLVGYANG